MYLNTFFFVSEMGFLFSVFYFSYSHCVICSFYFNIFTNYHTMNYPTVNVT